MKRRSALLLLTFVVASLALRLPNLRALPVFGDEAIFLRLAELLRERPLERAFLSLQDAKPPLHVWLLAPFLAFGGDPVFSGRLLSVVCGAATVVLLSFLASALQRGRESQAGEAAWPVGTAVLVLFCPFLALHQRLALADALFIAEACLAALLSVWLAQRPEKGEPLLGTALLLGIVLGSALLTRQIFSFALWMFPLLAPLTSPLGGRSEKFRRFVDLSPFLAASMFVALLMWLPMLFAPGGPPVRLRLFHQPGFLAAWSGPADLVRVGRSVTQLSEWLVTYLTPPIALSGAAGLLWLLRRPDRRGIGAFLLLWLVLTMLPLAFFGAVLFPRYALLAAPPVLLAAAALASHLLVSVLSISSRASRAAIVGLLAISMLAWPIRDTVLQVLDWRRQVLVPADAWQYVSGWPAGHGAQQAVAYLQKLAATSGIVVITTPDSGNPSDTIWLMLRGSPHVRLYYEIGFPDQTAQGRGRLGRRRLLLAEDLRISPEPQPVALPSNIRVVYASRGELYTPRGLETAAEHARWLYGCAKEIARFLNPRLGGLPQPDTVVLLELCEPAQGVGAGSEDRSSPAWVQTGRPPRAEPP